MPPRDCRASRTGTQHQGDRPACHSPADLTTATQVLNGAGFEARARKAGASSAAAASALTAKREQRLRHAASVACAGQAVHVFLQNLAPCSAGRRPAALLSRQGCHFLPAEPRLACAGE